MATGSEASLGTFEDLMAGSDSEAAVIARRLRRLVLDVHPAAVEVVRLGDGAASFGVGPRKMIEAYTYIMPMRGYVNLGFYRGASLADPAHLMEGTGKNMRHVKVRAPHEADEPALRTLIAEAFEERRAAVS